MAATGHWARWERTWVSGTSPSGAGVRRVVVHVAVWGGGVDQVFLLWAVCTVIPHWALSQLAPRLIELQGLIKPHYRAFISAPVCV